MKNIIVLLVAIVLGSTVASAQNLGRQNEWLVNAPFNIPIKASQPHYDTMIKFTHNFPTEVLATNADFYFTNIFGAKTYEKVSEHTYSGTSSYYFSIGNPKDINATFKVTYTLEIHFKDNKYSAKMHDFIIEHKNEVVDFRTSYDRAAEEEMTNKKMLAYFNKINKNELLKVYQTMRQTNAANEETAAR